MEKESAGYQKAQEYADRINSGEDRSQVLKDLPPIFTESVDKILATSKERQQEDIEAADEIRAKLGLPLQNQEQEKARQIEAAFNGMADGFSDGRNAKVLEYDQRIRAALAGNPIKSGDTFNNLKDDFRQLSGQEWSEDFVIITGESDVVEEPARQELTQEEVEALKQQITDIDKQVYFKNKNHLNDECFAVGHGILPDGTAFQKVSGETGINFDAHGISKLDQLDKLMSLLEDGIDNNKTFYTAPFEIPNENRAALGAALGTSGGTAYKDGIAVVTAGYKERLQDGGIKHVFINDVYSDLVEPLSRLFPQYQVHLLSEQYEVLEGEATAS